MSRYLFRRLLWFIPSWLIITLLAFYLSQLAPGDPVALLLGEAEQDRILNETAYLEKRKELGLDKPLFYFSIAALSETDTLFKIPRPSWREFASYWTFYTGNWQWVHHLLSLHHQLKTSILNEASNPQKNLILSLTDQFLTAQNPQDITQILTKIKPSLHSQTSKQVLQSLFQHVQNLEGSKTLWKNYIPVLHFYGWDNQYHHWLRKLITGDFGISYTDQRPIHTKILEALVWTLTLNLVSILIIYGLGILVGVYGASRYGTAREKWISNITLILYSMPNFWVGTMLIMMLGVWIKLFPISGVQSIHHTAEWGIVQRIADWAHHLILPIIAVSYGSIAFLSKQMQAAMLETFSMDYIQTARAKGLSKSVILWKHAFRNSLFPIITLFANVFPALVSGSVIIETIFSLPGMGFLLYQSIYARDYPVMIAVFTLSGTLTMLGILISDLLYQKIDPRVQFEK